MTETYSYQSLVEFVWNIGALEFRNCFVPRSGRRVARLLAQARRAGRPAARCQLHAACCFLSSANLETRPACSHGT